MKDNKVRKFLLPIGVLAISTLPFVSVVSCSKSPSKEENPGDGGNVTPPTDNREILNFSSAIPEVNYDRDGWVGTNGTYDSQYWDDNYDTAYRFMTKDQFRTIRNKVLNDEIKWFENDGITPIKYEISVTINEGMMISNGRANLSKPYDSTEYGTPSYNVWKTLPNKTSTSIVFWKKANNKSFKGSDFEFASDVELHDYQNFYGSKVFDLNSNICIDKNALKLAIGGPASDSQRVDGFISFAPVTQSNITDEQYNQIKSKYTTEDSQFANYVEGDKMPDIYINMSQIFQELFQLSH